MLWCDVEENGNSSGAMLPVGLLYVLGGLSLCWRFFFAGFSIITRANTNANQRQRRRFDSKNTIVISGGGEDSDLSQPLALPSHNTPISNNNHSTFSHFLFAGTILYLFVLFVLSTLLPNVWGKFTPPGIGEELSRSSATS